MHWQKEAFVCQDGKKHLCVGWRHVPALVWAWSSPSDPLHSPKEMVLEAQSGAAVLKPLLVQSYL